MSGGFLSPLFFVLKKYPHEKNSSEYKNIYECKKNSIFEIYSGIPNRFRNL